MRESRHVRYFNDAARRGEVFLHPGGRAATERLLAHLPALNRSSAVLELGAGLGQTALILLEKHPCRYTGLDASPLMLHHAGKLLAAHLARVDLRQCELRTEPLPVADGSVDAVVAESVIGIVGADHLLSEIWRVLTPGGRILWNDRIWGDRIDTTTAARINAEVDRRTGTLAAAIQPTTIHQWLQLLSEHGFLPLFHERLPGNGPDVLPNRNVVARLISTLLRPDAVHRWWQDALLSQKFKHIWPLMESWIVVAEKNASDN